MVSKWDLLISQIIALSAESPGILQTIQPQNLRKPPRTNKKSVQLSNQVIGLEVRMIFPLFNVKGRDPSNLGGGEDILSERESSDEVNKDS